VFVSGGTEGDHAGVIGAALALESHGRAFAFSALEHHAVHGAAAVLRRIGFAAHELPATAEGFVDPAAIDRLPAGVPLVSVMLANNETGVVQPVAAVAARAHARGVRLHCDAVQAAGKIAIDVESLGADYLVLSAHKLGGPKGVGALVVRRGAPFEPLFRGSAHEGGRRGGTENLPGIVGFGVAAELAARDLDTERARLLALRARLEGGIRAAAPTRDSRQRAPRLPNTVNALLFPGARSDLSDGADARGVCRPAPRAQRRGRALARPERDGRAARTRVRGAIRSGAPRPRTGG
jgi:cysteine desulfurase